MENSDSMDSSSNSSEEESEKDPIFDFPAATDDLVNGYLAPDRNVTLQDEYLALPSAEKISELAAHLSPKNVELEPKDIVSRAFQTFTEVNSELLSRRHTIVSRMSKDNLLTLCEILGVSGTEDTCSEAFRLKWDDPIAGPVIQALAARDTWINDWQLRKYDNGEIERDYSGYFQSFFSLSDEEINLCFPSADTSASTPSAFTGLADILSWVSGAEVDHQAYLLKAFNHLIVTDGCEPLTDPNDILAGLGVSPEDLPAFESSEVDAERNLLAEFRADFSPDLEIPKLGDTIADLAITQYWHPPFDHQKLAWLIKNFRPFWEKHKYTYLAEDSEYRSLSKKKSKAASAMHQKRETDLCLKIIADFISGQKGSKLPSNREERNAVFTSFTAGLNRAKKHEENALELLVTMDAHHKESATEILRKLKRSALERFQALPQDEIDSRVEKMKPRNRGLFDAGRIPENLSVFKSLTVEGVELCLEAWKEGDLKRTSPARGK